MTKQPVRPYGENSRLDDILQVFRDVFGDVLKLPRRVIWIHPVPGENQGEMIDAGYYTSPGFFMDGSTQEPRPRDELRSLMTGWKRVEPIKHPDGKTEIPVFVKIYRDDLKPAKHYNPYQNWRSPTLAHRGGSGTHVSESRSS